MFLKLFLQFLLHMKKFYPSWHLHFASVDEGHYRSPMFLGEVCGDDHPRNQVVSSLEVLEKGAVKIMATILLLPICVK